MNNLPFIPVFFLVPILNMEIIKGFHYWFATNIGITNDRRDRDLL
ncbi:hypothetical protein RintRC_7162 [Richelia intracellularis]|nr:hypothetical protein RintRC_7162 [Richelia intracellularis]